MKTRSGFVSNSSSSSFICDVCGRVESGMDMGLEEAEMYECFHGHTFCDSEIVGEYDNEPDEEDEDRDISEERYSMPTKHCPICSFKKFKDEDILKYLTAKKIIDIKEIHNTIRKTYKDYESFYDDITPKK